MTLIVTHMKKADDLNQEVGARTTTYVPHDNHMVVFCDHMGERQIVTQLVVDPTHELLKVYWFNGMARLEFSDYENRMLTFFAEVTG